LSRKKKARDDCVECHKPLPIGVGVHRLYCNECQVTLRIKWQRERYRKVNGLKKKKKMCMVCKEKFLPDDYQMKLCIKCMKKFMDRRNNLHCLFCGKHLQPNGRLKFFCNTKCSQPSWYVLRRMDPHYKRVTSEIK